MSRSVRFRFQIALPLLLAFCPLLVVASDLKAPQPLDIESVEDFAVYRTAISNQLQNSDTYAEITPENRNRAITLMAEMDAIIARSGSIAALPPLPRVDVFNRQEELNQILASAADDSRVVCRRERPTGSKFPVNNCKTMAQRREDRENGRKMMRDVIPSQEKIPGGR